MLKGSFAGRIFRTLRTTISASWLLVLIVSLVVNLALGIVSFVLQPALKATAVASAVTAVKAQAEIAERKAVTRAKAKEQAKARTQRTVAVASAVTAAQANAKTEMRAAVAATRAKEKAKGRVRRVSVAIPFVGAATAVAFEYWDYSEWQVENPDGDIKQYANETIEISKQITDEVLAELPVALKPDPEKLMAAYEWILVQVPEAGTEYWKVPEFAEQWFSWEE